MNATVTITFGDVAESHAGMQCIGQRAVAGFTLEDLQLAKAKLEAEHFRCVLVPLHSYAGVPVEAAYVLVVRRGVNYFCNADHLLAEQQQLTPDKKAWMYGQVRQKRARHNLCFADHSQEANYAAKQGTVISFDQVPLLSTVRSGLRQLLGDKADSLCAEGNYYYDVTRCGIGYHGDCERQKVVAVRLGCCMPLHFQWYLAGQPIGTNVKIDLQHGDLYVMSSKAVGTDCRRRRIPVVKHAAGCARFTRI